MFRVSCIQLKSNNNIHFNLKKTEKLILKAIKQKTNFILTPEVSSIFSLDKKQLLKDTTTYIQDKTLTYLNLISRLIIYSLQVLDQPPKLILQVKLTRILTVQVLTQH
mgnify:CR=1 FL=1